MGIEFRIRPGDAEDVPFLSEMLYEAATWRGESERAPKAEVVARPEIRRYLEEWGRPGDAAFIAEDTDGERLGAAWYRVFPPAAPGFGFIAPDIPELSIGIVPAVRRRGIGRALLAAIADRARENGYSALSLSVEPENPARRLYEHSGFRTVRDEGSTLTMRLDLAAGEGS